MSNIMCEKCTNKRDFDIKGRFLCTTCLVKWVHELLEKIDVLEVLLKYDIDELNQKIDDLECKKIELEDDIDELEEKLGVSLKDVYIYARVMKTKGGKGGL